MNEERDGEIHTFLRLTVTLNRDRLRPAIPHEHR